ncbi:enoyl-CoA hydratase [Amycolatopsis carbonis]|uniref:Enoyl-CoA hydratase n=1 Tax=Amycolatopsis carbonis TaxID=715471 RepID=A0A9Y2MQI5_9PSEU|nr:enoyl-CoA hydratase [Amycolatopsis sp. 2-15]WIX77305.1 enoyl-CoA hydratase [Amycolatopsis sp. 2-15]
MSKVELENKDGRWSLTLAAPDRRNCLDARMCQDLADALATVAADADARALVVTGAGKAFCAGADLPAVFGETGREVAQIRRDLHTIYNSFLRLRGLAIPTVAAVQGAAVGAGLNLALACDVRIAGPRASFAATFSRIGLHPGGGCTWFLVDVLGSQRALAVLLDGGALSGEAAVRAGLALELADDPVAVAIAYADRWAAADPVLVRDIKKAVGLARTGGFEATLEFESWAQASSATGPAVQAAVAKFR